jgi:hypothetical protein
MNSTFNVEENGDDLPTIRDFTSSYNQIVNGCVNVLLLLLQTLLQIFSICSTVLKSIQNLQNVAFVKVSKALYVVTIKQFNWSHFIFVSDIYNMIKFMDRFFLSIAVSYFVLGLKDTYVWKYFIETLIVPIVTVSIPLHVCSNRQLIGPPFSKQQYVTVTLWICNSILLYFILVAFLNIHLHQLHYRHQQGQDKDTRVVLNNMEFVYLLSLMEIPICLTIVAWKAVKVNYRKVNYALTTKNTLVVNVLYQCMSPIIGFVICFRSRSGLVYPILYLQQLFSWGNSVVALAVHFTFETMLADTFHHLTEAEVNELRDDDVCPVCLMGHTTDSCRLACNHLAHSGCLITMMQVRKKYYLHYFVTFIVISAQYAHPRKK